MRLHGKVPKSWGREEIFITNDLYCGKHLIFDTAGNKTTMHFHLAKHETWKVERGKFIARHILTDCGEVKECVLDVGDTFVIEPLVPHQLEALEDDSCVLEISTADSVEDNYRLYR
jgi:hypothetical protein